MKTLAKIASLVITLSVLTTINLNASETKFSEESYIDDIPFNTKDVYDNLLAVKNLTEFNFEEEQYIDDIPFDTECVSAECLYQKAISVEFNFEEEVTIEDLQL